MGTGRQPLDVTNAVGATPIQICAAPRLSPLKYYAAAVWCPDWNPVLTGIECEAGDGVAGPLVNPYVGLPAIIEIEHNPASVGRELDIPPVRR